MESWDKAYWVTGMHLECPPPVPRNAITFDNLFLEKIASAFIVFEGNMGMFGVSNKIYIRVIYILHY